MEKIWLFGLLEEVTLIETIGVQARNVTIVKGKAALDKVKQARKTIQGYCKR